MNIPGTLRGIVIQLHAERHEVTLFAFTPPCVWDASDDTVKEIRLLVVTVTYSA